MSAYAALIEAFPADVEVTRYGDRVEFRIAADARLSVDAEVARISQLCHDRAWVRFIGPIQWIDTWVAYGELRERLDQ